MTKVTEIINDGGSALGLLTQNSVLALPRAEVNAAGTQAFVKMIKGGTKGQWASPLGCSVSHLSEDHVL